MRIQVHFINPSPGIIRAKPGVVSIPRSTYHSPLTTSKFATNEYKHTYVVHASVYVLCVFKNAYAYTVRNAISRLTQALSESQVLEHHHQTTVRGYYHDAQ